MSEGPADITVIDTLMWGHRGMTSAFLVDAPQPALIDTGPRTSFDVVLDALTGLGLGRDDLAWIVLTHVHLDHCGGAGDLATHFPNARVVVHRRGARHLAHPSRLVAGSAAVYGEHFDRYGDLAAVDPDRIDVAEDGHHVPLGPDRHLLTIETPGHARHHNAYQESATGAVLGGDVLGMEFHGGELFPALPPPDVDVAAGQLSAERIATTEPSAIGVGHYGWLRDPSTAPDRASEVWRKAGEAGRAGWDAGRSVEAVEAALEYQIPSSRTLSPTGLGLITELGWLEHSYAGLAAWAESEGDDPSAE